jgi:gamma-glutamylcyclotransferase (GGCT)/AIG2-like uncharacterized protein YtfP
MPVLFLYGTLKRGQRNHRLVAGEFLGPARSQPHYRLVDCGPYPALVEDRDHGESIQGELWRVDDAILRRLDEFEGAPLPDRHDPDPEFVREPIDVLDHAGLVFAYFYRRDTSALPGCGDCWPAATS